MELQTIEGFQLSPQQKRLWRIQPSLGGELRSRSAVLIEGPLGPELLRSALDRVVRRHEILRTRFECLPGMTLPVQVVESPAAVPLRRLEEVGEGFAEPFARLEAAAGGGPALGAALLAASPDRHVLLLSLPSLCADPESLRNLVREIGRTYQALLQGEAEPGEPLQYADVAAAFNEILEAEDTGTGRTYWQGLALPEIGLLRLPCEREVGDAAGFSPRAHCLLLDAGLASGLRELADRRGLAVSSLLLAAWQLLLGRLSGREEMVVGLALGGRTYEGMEDALGLFARYVPLPCRWAGGSTFPDLAAGVEEAGREARDWQEYFDAEGVPAMAGALSFPFTFRAGDGPAGFTAGGLRFTVIEEESLFDRFTLELECATGGGIDLVLRYDARRLDLSDVAALGRQLVRLLESAVEAPETPAGALDLMGAAERRQVLEELNDTGVRHSWDRPLHELFQLQAERSPGRVAVESDEGLLTYAELDARANRLARRLRRLGVGPEARVAVCAERSPGMVVGLLAVLKAGGAYVPLDPLHPAERLGLLLADVGPRAVLAQQRTAERLPDSGVPVLLLDSPSPDGDESLPAPPESGADLASLAYVIHTSGTTGRPKGVMVSHGAILNRLAWMQDLYPLTESDRVLQKTTFTFDASIWEVFLPLLAGARVTLARPGGEKDPAYLAEAVAAREVTVLQLVPSVLRLVLEEPGLAACVSLRRLFCGGEALPADLVERVARRLPAVELVNLYGPTEAAIDATSWPLRRGVRRRVAPIGTPISNMRAYLLDAELRPVPVGMPGDLYVAGAGLARGYVDQPAPTAAVFLPDPFGGVPGQRLYRTGDRGFLRADGAIEFLGRADHQVKLRGYRIELAEVELALRSHPGVRAAVAVVREDEPGDPRLVAYAVPRSPRTAPREDLYRLPNGLEVAQLNPNETELIFREVFIEDTYFQHGIRLEPGSCVFDVGANIGLFTLQVATRVPGVRIHSFEPIPPVFDKLRANASLHGIDAVLHPCGLGERSQEAEFTFYPDWSGMSGRYADAGEDERITRAFLLNQDRDLAGFEDELLAGRFAGEVYRCPVRTLSEVLRESGIDAIDLLKIDVEKAELDVLRGIAEEDWSRIRQIVIEAHDRDGQLAVLTALLRERGFDVVVEDPGLLASTGLYNVYAIHRSLAERPPLRPAAGDGAPAPVRQPAPSAAELRSHLQQRLPEYMVPSAIVLLDELPLKPNGKLDRDALPPPSAAGAETGKAAEHAPPRTPVEEMLAALWEDLLHVERVGIHDDFFDLGGHSILATRIVSRVRQVFGVDLRVRSLFEAPTVAGLAAVLEKALRDGGPAAAPPLAPVDRGGPLPLSFAQERLWFLDRLTGGTAAYNLPMAFLLTGPLDPRLLERSLSEVVRRHEVLRTAFPEDDGRPRQAIAPELDVAIPVVDLAGIAGEEGESLRLAREEAARPFDLGRGPLLRAALLRLAPQRHVLLFSMHHIVGDGWSTGILLREISALYGALAAGRPSGLPALPFQYADYASWQRRWLQGEVLESVLGYWRRYLAGSSLVLELPTDRPRPPEQSYRGARRPVTIPAPLTAALARLGREQGATLFMTLAAAFGALLHRYSGQRDILIGSPIANRGRAEVEELIGVFINMFVLRESLSGDLPFGELLARVREGALGAYAHQDLPFERLVEAMEPARDLSRSPLFQVMFTLQNNPGTAGDLPGIAVNPLHVDGGSAKFDLTLEIAPASGGLSGFLELSTALFDASTVDRMGAHLAGLLAAFSADPGRRVGDPPLLAGAERWQLLGEWNDTGREPVPDGSIYELFERQARRAPDAPALAFDGRLISFGELERQAARVAARLAPYASPEARIAVFLRRSPDVVAAILGVLKAGAAYVPLDPAYPRERLRLVLEDAQARAVITEEALRDALPDPAPPVVFVDGGTVETGEARYRPVGPDRLAYVIYTSGTTGRPKGVMVTQGNVLAFFHAMDRVVGPGPGVWLAVTSISFDISVLELLWTLTRGFEVVLQEDPASLLAPAAGAAVAREVQLSLFYFANDDAAGDADRYRLLIEGARWADRAGLAAVWTPERHFHSFGGLYPNPAVTGAALAAVTERIQIRAGSVVLPLHDPIRVAEEWAIVDNLSHGRVGISFASGWHADDFVLKPENYRDRKQVLLRDLEVVRRLWRGETVTREGGAGKPVEIGIHPHPVQAELPVWLTAAGNPETFRAAGEAGARLLTHLLGQELDELEEKIALYRRAFREQGHAGEGWVTLMLHTFVGEDDAAVRARARQPFLGYLRGSLGLLSNLAKALGQEVDPAQFSEADVEALLERSFERYASTNALLGSVDTCLRLVDRLRRMGVDEIACLIDFGVETDAVLASLRHLEQLAGRLRRTGGEDATLASRTAWRQVTHLQCTPSLAKLLADDPAARGALAGLEGLLVGGEALPAPLARRLREILPGRVHNMYGPTETTVWSATEPLSPGEGPVAIGRPVAGTRIHVVDGALAPLPVGVPGEILIGGAGVARGYLGRPEVTAERFVPDAWSTLPGARLYRTGDLARFLPDGRLEFLGRLDHQVKIRGHRIELGEIESVLASHPGVSEAVVVGREQEGETRLAAYYVPVRPDRGGPVIADPGEGPAAPAPARSPHTWPNGMQVVPVNDYQANAAYREIFENRIYLRHGVTLEAGDVVFDVGANSGFFSLFAHHAAPGLRIYAFEPIPPTFATLEANARLHALDAHLFRCGLSNRRESAVLTFYPQMPGLSGRYSEAARDAEATRAIMLAGLKRHGLDRETAVTEADLDALLGEQFRSERYACRLRTLSDVVDELAVEAIDLLKVDVERAEVDVLEGIRPEHWSRIRQLALEVDTRENLDRIVPLLEAHGFRVAVDDFVSVQADQDRPRVDVYMVYAVSPRAEGRAAGRRPRRSGAAEPSAGELREHLQRFLPDFMLPAALVRLAALPLTPNGKVDRRALPAPAADAREHGPAFAPPRTPVEQRLAEIWRQLLRVDRVGIHDNFFELGGDSILAIQFIARAHQAGLRLTPRQLFQHQTLAALAPQVGLAAAVREEQGPVVGAVPLTPIQHWLLEQELPDLHHFNQSLILALRQPVAAALAERVVAGLLAHHDALRMRFERRDGAWSQHNAAPGGPVPFLWIDLAALPQPRQAAAIEDAATALQGGLDLARGPLFETALFTGLAGGESRLLLVAHHLVIDGVTWRVLLEDFEAGCLQLARGEELRFPDKTTSFRRWAERLAGHARSAAVREEAGYWLEGAVREARPLPVDFPGGRNDERSARSFQAELDADETRALLQEAPARLRAQVEEILLAALLGAVARWSGGPSLRIELEHHGRTDVLSDVDLSRTAGWFGTFSPLLLEAGETEPGALLRAVKERLRAMPGRGIGYGLLRYLGDPETSEALRSSGEPGISFNYLGQLDQSLEGSLLFAPARESTGPAHSPRQPRRYPLDCIALVADGRLKVRWIYSANLHREETIARLSADLLDVLGALIRHRPDEEASGLVAADFPLAGLAQPDLDRLLAEHGPGEDVYPLSPVQQGLLFDTLDDPAAGYYVIQLSCTLAGPLDSRAFAAAWRRVLDRHPALRSSFAWEGLREPLQLVRRDVEPAISYEDWSGVPGGELSSRLEGFLEADRRRGFPLTRAPLMRLALLRSAAETHQLVWSHHHLLLDGWSAPLVVGEVLACYRAFREGTEPALPEAAPYRDYIRWLRAQDLARAERFWRPFLAGFKAPNRVRDDLSGTRTAGQGEGESLLSAEATRSLQDFARRHRLTLSTLVQGAWALVLGRRSGDRDLVYGVVSSGRPAELPGVESMVGVFISTLPMRVAVGPEQPLLPWLQGLQESLAEVRQLEFSPLVQVQGWSEVPRGTPLFESILVFENLPTEMSASGEGGLELELRDLRSSIRESFPLVLVVHPGARLALRIKYDRGAFRDATAELLLAQVGDLLQAVAADPEANLGSLERRVDEMEQRHRSRQEEELERERLSTLKRARRREVGK